MDKFIRSVRLDEAACQGCINCIKYCPTQAIRVHNGKAHIIDKFCIDCGRCIRYCPHHAKIPAYDPLTVINDFKYTVALPAPSLYAQYRDASRHSTKSPGISNGKQDKKITAIVAGVCA